MSDTIPVSMAEWKRGREEEREEREENEDVRNNKKNNKKNKKKRKEKKETRRHANESGVVGCWSVGTYATAQTRLQREVPGRRRRILLPEDNTSLA